MPRYPRQSTASNPRPNRRHRCPHLASSTIVRTRNAMVNACMKSTTSVEIWSLLDSGEKKDSDVPYQEPESTKSSRQRVHTAQACENTLRTGSAIPDNPGIREVIPSTSIGWAFVTKESPSP